MMARDASASSAAAALGANKAAFAALLGSLPGATLHVQPGLSWLDTGLPDTAFNGVYQAQLAEDEIAPAVARVRSHFQRRRLPFRWEVGLRPEPAGIGEILTRHGLRHNDDEPGMWLDLNTLRESQHAVVDLSIHPVTDRELLRQWVWVWGCGAPPDVTERWYQVYSALPFGPDTSLRMFIGFLDGRPAATVYLYLAAGVAAVHYVVTRHEFRHLGIGTAMTNLAVREGRAAGYRIAVLTASSLGINIYRRMGFQQCCLVRTFDWCPDRPDGLVEDS